MPEEIYTLSVCTEARFQHHTCAIWGSSPVSFPKSQMPSFWHVPLQMQKHETIKDTTHLQNKEVPQELAGVDWSVKQFVSTAGLKVDEIFLTSSLLYLN